MLYDFDFQLRYGASFDLFDVKDLCTKMVPT